MGLIKIEQNKINLVDTINNYLYDGLMNGTSDFVEWCEDEIKERKISLNQVNKIQILVEQLQNAICKENNK